MTIQHAFVRSPIARPAPSLLALAMALFVNHAQAQSKDATQDTAATQHEAEVSVGVVNINTASAEELMRLPGVGPAKAEAILALRDKLKRFPKVATLMRVRGIGRKTYARLRPMLALEGPTTLVEPSKRKAKSKTAQVESTSTSATSEEDVME